MLNKFTGVTFFYPDQESRLRALGRPGAGFTKTKRVAYIRRSTVAKAHTNSSLGSLSTLAILDLAVFFSLHYTGIKAKDGN